jgi:O-antigen/teichoic acid export membrane protein
VTRSGAAAEGSAALIVRNTLVSGLGSVAGVLAPLILTPLLIDRLGVEAYAVWVFATTLTLSAGYLSLADLGAQQATVRFVADARRAGDVTGANEFFSTSFALFLGIALLIAPLIALSSPVIVDLFGVHPGITAHATMAFQIVAASLLFDLPSLAYRSMLEGAQHYVAVRSVDLVRVVLVSAGSLAAVLLGYGLVALALVYFVAAALAFAASAVAVRLVVPGSALARRYVGRQHLRKLMTFGGALFSLRIVSVIYRQMDRVIIALVLGVALVTRYEIANKIQAAVGVVLAISSSALLPAAAFIRADTARLRELFLRGTCYTVAITVPVTLAAIFFAEPLVTGWVGPEWQSAVGITRLFLVWMALSAFTTVGWSIFVALGRLRPIVLLNVAWVALNLGLSLWLVYPLGVAGVIWGTLISAAVLNAAYVVLFLKELGIGVGEWVRRIVAPNVPGVCVEVAVGLALLWWTDLPRGLLEALAAGAVCTGISLATFMYVGLRGSERRELLATIRSATGLKRGSPQPPSLT